MKPKQYDNAWLGIAGEGIASLHTSKGDLVGTCLDTPNCIAYAMVTKPAIAYAISPIFGKKKRTDLQDRLGWVAQDEAIHSPNIRFKPVTGS